MFTQHNGLYLPTPLVNAVQSSNAIAAAFTNGITANASTAALVAPVAPTNAPTAPSRNRTHYMFMCIAAGLNNSQAVAAVNARYGMPTNGHAATNNSSISWCRQANTQLAQGKQTKQAQVAKRMHSYGNCTPTN